MSGIASDNNVINISLTTYIFIKEISIFIFVYDIKSYLFIFKLFQEVINNQAEKQHTCYTSLFDTFFCLKRIRQNIVYFKLNLFINIRVMQYLNQIRRYLSRVQNVSYIRSDYGVKGFLNINKYNKSIFKIIFINSFLKSSKIKNRFKT